jgi:hypothetical protein
MTTKIDKLHDQARLAIESGERALAERAREAAEYLAEARNLGATQRDSAEAIGKSAGWVNALLRWRDGGYLTVFPFPRAARPLFGPRGRVQAAEQKNRLSKKNRLDHQRQPKRRKHRQPRQMRSAPRRKLKRLRRMHFMLTCSVVIEKGRKSKAAHATY